MPARLNLAAAALTLSLAVPAPAALVRGEAGRSDGKTIGGAVKAWHFGAKEGEPVVTAALEAGGRFALDLAPGLWDLEAHPTGLAPARQVVPVFGAPVDLEPVTFEPTQRTRLQVVSPSGRPVAGARVCVVTRGLRGDGVSAWWPLAQQTVSDTEGSAWVDVSTPEQTFVLVAAAEGDYAGPFRGRLSLLPGTAVRVVDAQDRPVAGARLAISGWLPFATTDTEGRALVPRELASGSEAGLVVGVHGLPRRATARPVTAPSEPVAAVVLALGEPGLLDVRVVDAADGRAVAGAFLWNMELGVWDRSDDRGEVRMALDFPALLSVAAEGYLDGSVSARGVATAEPAVVRLDPAVALRGRVVDAGGQPIQAASVVLRSRLVGSVQRLARTLPAAPRVTRSDAEGVFQVLAGIDSTGELAVSAPGFASWTSQVGIAREAPAWLDVVLEPEIELIGRVVGPEGQPVAAAVVTVQPLSRRWSREELPGGQSDREGRFVVAGLGPGDVALRIAAPGFPPLALGNVGLSAGAPQVDVGTLVLAAGMPVLGRVVDTEGRPRAGIRVFANRHEPDELSSIPIVAVTEADGSFELAGFRAGERVAVRPQTELMLMHETLFVAGEPRRDIVLQASYGLAVRAENPDGTPATDALIHLERRHGGSSSSTGSSGGRAQLTGLDPGTTVVIRASGAAGDAGPLAVEISGERESEQVVLRLERRPGIELRVVDRDGLPVAGAEVRLGEPTTWGRDRITDESGRLRVAAGPGEVTLEVRHPDFEAARREVLVSEAETSVEVVLQRRDPLRGRLRGQVVDAEGRGLVGASVRLLADGRFREEAVSGPDGAFEIVAPSGTQIGQLMVSLPGLASAEAGPLDLTSDQAVPLRLELGPGGEVVGRVTGVGPEAVTGAIVGATMLGGALGFEQARGVVDAGGGFVVRGLRPGKWALSVLFAGGREGGSTLVEISADGDRVETEIEVAVGRRIAGRIRRGERPAAGVDVDLRCRHVVVNTLSGSDGYFAFDAPSEPCRVEPRSAAEQGVEVPETGDVELDLQLPPTGELAGAVTDALGTPIAGAVVEVFATSDEECIAVLRQAASREDGSFLVRDRPPGVLRLRAAAPGYGRAVALVAPGGEAFLALVAGPSPPRPDAPGCLP